MSTTIKTPTVSQLAANVRAAITPGVSANSKARKNVRALIQNPEGLPAIEGIVKDYANQNRLSQDTNKANNKALRKAITNKAKKDYPDKSESDLKQAISDAYNATKARADSTAWDLIRKIIPSEFKKVGMNASVSASDGSLIIEPISDSEPESGKSGNTGNKPEKQPETNRDLYAEAFDAATALKESDIEQFKIFVESMQNILANSQVEKKAANK